MRYVGNELITPGFGLLQRLCHGVEGLRQLSDLIVPVRDVHAHGQVATAVTPGSLRHFPQGLRLNVRVREGKGQGQYQHKEADEEKQRQDRLPDGESLVGIPRDEQIPQRSSVGGAQGGHDRIALLGVHSVHPAQLRVGAGAGKSGHEIPVQRHADVFTGKIRVGAGLNDTVRIRDEYMLAVAAGYGGERHAQLGSAKISTVGVGHGDHRELAGGAVHLSGRLGKEDAPAGEPEGDADKQKADQDQHGRADEVAYIRAVHHESLSSNLYPTPHTVLSDHLSDTPSSFSRRRLMWTSTVRESPK